MRCDMCGNEYERPLLIRVGDASGEQHAFDSFECAIHMLAPRCAHCGCTIVGHGIQLGAERFACCAHCARELNEPGAVDNLEHAGATPEARAGTAPTRPPSDS
jgi:hypothetical protein